MQMLENTPEFWKHAWQKHLAEYFSAPPRTGIFINHFLNKKISKVLEIACGSSRDSIYLAKEDYFVVASDFDENTINILKSKYILKNLKYLIADAFKLPFGQNSFDLVFHNGFFIYFSDDNKIMQLLREQERVSRYFILILVHNYLNNKLYKQFKELSKEDPLYDIRFFTIEDLEKILGASKIQSRKVSFFKFGGPADILYNKILFRIIPNIFYPIRETIIPILYQFQSWEMTERIACLIELNK